MQIVIDISKDRYDEIMSMDWKNCRLLFDEEIRAIHDGKALEQEPCEVSQGLVKDSQGFSQEPCGDAVSRQAVLEAIDVKAWEFCDYLIRNGRNDEQKPVSHFADNLRECVGEDLPPVTPQPKMGRWLPIEYDGYADGSPVWDKWECSECGYEHSGDEESLTAFCPNCGAKM